MAGTTTLEESIGMKMEQIKKICSLALDAHKLTDKPYHIEETARSSETFISFKGSWSVNDWFAKSPFGETKIDLQQFPSIRSIGNDEAALVNEAFLNRFKEILGSSSLEHEVQTAVTEKKKIVFTGHSSGAPIAILAALRALEKKRESNSQISLLCVTFGSPLVGNRIFSHALRREKWSDYFINFVARYDIVPRVLLAPLSSIQQNLDTILQFFNPQSPNFKKGLTGRSRDETKDFYLTVMKNAATITSHAACNLMQSTNLLVETITSFFEPSPYRPFGTYIFCTENGKLIVIKNPDAILQLLFHSFQLSNEARGAEVVLQKHLNYQSELQGSNVVYLDQLEKLPLSEDGSNANINSALNDLGMSTRARLCLRAAGEFEMRKIRIQVKFDNKMDDVKKGLDYLDEHKEMCKGGYYDAFKLQKEHKDFLTNVKRLELAGIWDEIIELLKRYEFPDEFEGREEWIDLGTRFRRIVEPLDIANYYRHLKNEDAGAYMIKGRPKRYRYTQRWLEHKDKFPTGACSESTFWAEVEEFNIKTNNKNRFEDIKEKVQQIEKDLDKWIQNKVLSKDIFLEDSTFVVWWRKLPPQHRSGSWIENFIPKREE
ncbi:Enhanced disease susceptibility 1 [Quillaja saponaria]|uniref:Enhanced disease susceptibility 1 n=1 Tax=Quillaja saponaria TaxID=32244 RepID=A0AAD7P860_QUISA|nr:Enhanced disease susceptibility 1 [Quillaja saponaria]